MSSPPPKAINVSDAIFDLRTHLRMSQQAFATKLGISIRAVANYEKDRVPDPARLRLLIHLAKESCCFALEDVFRRELFKRLGSEQCEWCIEILSQIREIEKLASGVSGRPPSKLLNEIEHIAVDILEAIEDRQREREKRGGV